MPRHGLYMMEMNYGRNCYNCGDFGHLARNCRNRRIIRQGRRLEYEDNLKNIANLNREESPVVFN